jgi:hypothetical protein
MGLAILRTATETPFALIFPLFYLPIPIDLVSLRLRGKNLQKTAFSRTFPAFFCKFLQKVANSRTFPHVSTPNLRTCPTKIRTVFRSFYLFLFSFIPLFSCTNKLLQISSF